jgi:glycosyltransferase involved in cell wall biosynthesis
MKIVHVETGMHLYGGAQQVAWICAGLAERGHDNLLVCPPGAAIGRHFEGSAVRVRELPCSGDADLTFIFRLAALLRRERPDLVHLHSRRGADALGGLAARLASVPAVLSRRVDNAEAPWLARLKYRLYGRTICISEGIAEVLRSEGVEPTRLRVVRSALLPSADMPTSRAELQQQFGIADGRLCIGVVAQLIERKGHRLLLAALRADASLANRVQVLCFGQGPLRAALEAESQGLPVQFVGFRDDLQRWLPALDLLVHPALREGLGVSLLQASAAGVPIIASRAGGIPEAVRDGINGLLVPPGDAPALGAALHRLVDDAGLRRQLGEQGRSLMKAEFSVAAMVEGNLAVYREVLAERGSR